MIIIEEAGEAQRGCVYVALAGGAGLYFWPTSEFTGAVGKELLTLTTKPLATLLLAWGFLRSHRVAPQLGNARELVTLGQPSTNEVNKYSASFFPSGCSTSGVSKLFLLRSR